MKECGKIAITLLFACALLAGCANRNPMREYLETHGESVEIVALPKAVSQEVHFTTGDEEELSADYYPGKGEHPAGVILFHDQPGNRKDWDTLIDDLVAKGYAVLAPDSRVSFYPPAASPHTSIPDYFRYGLGSLWEGDVEAAIAFLKERGIPADRIVVVHNDHFSADIAMTCKGVIVLNSLWRLPDKCPGRQIFIYDSAPAFPENNRQDRDDVTYKDMPNLSEHWIMVEVRVTDPAATRAQADILEKRLTDLHLDHVIRFKGDSIIRIFAPEHECENIEKILTPGKLEFWIEDDSAMIFCIIPLPRRYTQEAFIATEEEPFFVASDFSGFCLAEDADGKPVIHFDLTYPARRRLEEAVQKSSRKEAKHLIVTLDNQIVCKAIVSTSVQEGRGTMETDDEDVNKERDRLLAIVQSKELAIESEKTRFYLITSVEDNKARAVRYALGVVGRKFGDFDVNANILRDIEAILAEKK